MNTDIRWKQRLENFKKAVAQLEEFVQQQALNKFERQWLIHCFKYSFELGWKTLKDYLENGGQNVATPRAAIQPEFQAGSIGDGHSWIDALQSAKIFGSRAEGNQHSSSDVDLALVGEQISLDVVAKVHLILEEQSKMPYLFDIVDYTHLTAGALREHIERVGVTIFRRPGSKI